MKKRKGLIVTGIIFIVFVLLIGMAAARRGSKPEMVKTTNITTGDLKSYLSTNAAIKSQNSKNYMGASQLTIKIVNVKVGDHVAKGKVMLEYDLSDLKNNLDQAKIQYSNAELQRDELKKQKDQLDQAINDLDKQIKQLETSKNPSDAVKLQSLQQERGSLQPISNEKIKLSDNSVSLAKLALDSAKSKYYKYAYGIVSEFDGVVTALNATAGSSVSPAQPVIVVQQLDNLKAVISLGKYDAAKVKLGQEVNIKSGENTYKGAVSFLSPAATELAQETSLTAEINILDKSPDLKVDFDTNVDILLGSVTNAVKVPVECIQYDKDGKSFVYKLVDNKAKKVEVRLGLQSDVESQVIEGLSAGDTVILNPSLSLKDGSKVKVSKGDSK